MSEPPLYDLFCGALLDLPASMRAGTALVLYLGLGAAMAVATLLLLIDLRVPRWLSVTGTLLVVGDPSMVLYEQWLSWSYPTAALLVIGTLGLVRLARTGAARWAAVSAGCFCAVALLDTTFQWPWLLLALGAIAWAGRFPASLRGQGGVPPRRPGRLMVPQRRHPVRHAVDQQLARHESGRDDPVRRPDE